MGIASVSSVSIPILMGLVVSFAGQIGSGKSSVSNMLAETLGWPRVGFGDYLRDEVRRCGGNPDSRKALQDFGESLVDSNPEIFCHSVLDVVGFSPGADLLLDGVRHGNIQKIVQRIVAPSKAKLIYLSADDCTRFERVMIRPDGQADFARANQHQVEGELKDSLPALADKVVDTGVGINAAVRNCLSLIHTWSH